MSKIITRREFFRTSGACVVTVGLSAGLPAQGKDNAVERMPQIQLGSLRVSRA